MLNSLTAATMFAAVFKTKTSHGPPFMVMFEAKLMSVVHVYLCHKGVTRVLKGCYKSSARVLQGCYKGVTKVLQGCYKDVTYTPAVRVMPPIPAPAPVA
jgi:hypothetical protein